MRFRRADPRVVDSQEVIGIGDLRPCLGQGAARGPHVGGGRRLGGARGALIDGRRRGAQAARFGLRDRDVPAALEHGGALGIPLRLRGAEHCGFDAVACDPQRRFARGDPVGGLRDRLRLRTERVDPGPLLAGLAQRAGRLLHRRCRRQRVDPGDRRAGRDAVALA